MLADRETGREADRWQHAFEPLTCALAVRRQLRRHDRRCRMDLGAGVTGNQADNPLDLCGIVACAGIYAALAQSVERSEEHTSELQSLMRISYAVFCLKKKKTQ